MGSPRSWKIRESAEQDALQISELFEIVFGTARPLDHLEWKHLHNPDRVHLTVVAEDNGKIVGQYALWATPMLIGAESVKGAQSLETMSHPEYRGQGMFTVLAEACMGLARERGIEVLYGFPNQNSYPGFVRKLDWDHTGDVGFWVRPLVPSKHGRVPKYFGHVADVAANILPTGEARKFQIRDEMPDEKDLTPLLSQWKAEKGLCRIDRNYERYIWRFSPKSGSKYKWVAAYSLNQLSAFSVWAIEPRRRNALLCEVQGVSSDAIDCVISRTIIDAKKENCPFLQAATNEPVITKILPWKGFIRARSIPLIVRKLTTRTLGANIHNHYNWRIQGADLDTF